MKTHSTPKTIFKLHSNHMHRCNDCSVCRPKTEHVVLCVVVLLLLSHGFYLVGEKIFCGCDKRTGIMALVRGHDFQLMITIYMPFRLQTIDGSQFNMKHLLEYIILASSAVSVCSHRMHL